ncbi:hypothetical protein [Flavobacterium sp.]|uniref:hypothetical protein n=1 Tax=Flavobacterium sp. TaxID=239 RepID=UPI0026327FB2|nr:hypothetical protein [Flavobacterium sp.]
MKHLFLFLVFLSTVAAPAQDYKLIENAKRAESKETAAQIANLLVSAAPSKYRLYTMKESQNAGVLRFRFVQQSLTDEDLKNGNFTEAQRQAFITIDFSFYNAGEDINAVRPEFVTYKLNEITAMYDELFAMWKTFFKPQADFEKTKTDANSQYLKDAAKKIDIYIFHAESGWTLRNLSAF